MSCLLMLLCVVEPPASQPSEGDALRLPDDPVELMNYIVKGRKERPPGTVFAPTQAVEKLFQVVDRATFDRFAAEQIQLEPDPWVRGMLRYLSRLPEGAELPKRYPIAPSVLHWHNYRRNPYAWRWLPYNQFLRTLDHECLSVSELMDHYRAHAGGDPNDLLIRKAVIGALRDADDRAQARAALIMILACEPDHSNRLDATIGLAQVCTPIDTEVADYLESVAAYEPELTNVRPLMEYVSQVLRAGLSDERSMSPMP